MYKPQRSSGGSSGWSGPKKFGGRDSYDRRSSGGRDSYERPPMHDAVCHDCGQACQVPFRPNGSKPVFCSNCFKKEENGGDAPRFGMDDRRGGGSYPEKRMFSAECDKCGEECEVPFKPNGSKPVYCRACFGTVAPTSDRREESPKSPDRLDGQLKSINIKLEAILKLLSPATAEKPEVKEIKEVKEAKKEFKAVVKDIEAFEQIVLDEAPKKVKKAKSKKAE